MKIITNSAISCYGYDRKHQKQKKNLEFISNFLSYSHRRVVKTNEESYKKVFAKFHKYIGQVNRVISFSLCLVRYKFVNILNLL